MTQIVRNKKTQWNKNPFVRKYRETRNKNMVKTFSGPKAYARNITNQRSAFDKLFTDGNIITTNKILVVSGKLAL